MAMSVVYTTVNGQVLSENRGGVVHYFIPDPLGSVVMVRDTSGNTVYEAEYAPYGDVQSETGTNPSEFGYVGTLGYVKDSASSLYVRARYLLTNLGRWLTKDPLWPEEPGFVYSEARPVSIADPSGRQPCPRHGWGGKHCRYVGPPGRENDLNPGFWLCAEIPWPEGDPYGFWKDGIWAYGGCCGPTRACGSGSKTYSCTDDACKEHDICVGSEYFEGFFNWHECNRGLCNDIKYCWNQNCVIRFDWKQCHAIKDIASVFCGSFGGGPPVIGGIWR